MLLVVAAALLGAYLGMNSRNRLLAALVTAALVGAAYLVFDFLAGFVISRSADRGAAMTVFNVLGVASDGLARAMAAGAAAAVISGLLSAFLEPKVERPGLYLPGEEDFRPKPRRRLFRHGRQSLPTRSTAALNRIDQVLNS